MSKKKKYVELHILANALVPKGAVGEEAVFKADGFFSRVVPVTKYNDDKMEMYTVLYMLGKEDSQGYICDDVEVLEKARDEFMENGGLQKITLTHGGEDLKGKVFTNQVWTVKREVKKTGEELDDEILVEDVVLRDPVFPDDKYIGALVACTKFTDEELWERAKVEKWQTSIEGKAKVVDIKDEEDAEKAEGKLVKFFKSLFNEGKEKAKLIEENFSKDFLSKLEDDRDYIWKYVDLLYSAIWDIWYDVKNGKITSKDAAERLEVDLKQFKDTLLNKTKIFAEPIQKGDESMKKAEVIAFLKSEEGAELLKSDELRKLVKGDVDETTEGKDAFITKADLEAFMKENYPGNDGLKKEVDNLKTENENLRKEINELKDEHDDGDPAPAKVVKSNQKFSIDSDIL